MDNVNRRQAANHPAIQNLRRFLKEYTENSPSHTLSSFASKLGRKAKDLGRYLRGEVTPRRKMIEEWASAFGVDYEYMMNANFDYIEYPFIRESSPKKGGSHITKREVRKNYDDMMEEVNAFVCENYDSESCRKILEIIEKHKI